MADEDEWKKLSTEDKVQHKSWKARAEGYKECIKKFPMLDEKSPDFSKYLGLIKKFVIDSNELNRIQGLQATLLFVENASVAGRTCGEVVSGIVSKCFNAKPRLKEIGTDVCFMYIEIDKNELVQEELIKGFDNKQPKIVHACVEVITKALCSFGSKVISLKPLIKQTIKLLDHRDKNVREASKSLFVEIFRWIGPAVRAPLQNINAVTLKELEDEWEKIGAGGQAKQTRFMRSQQDLREKMEAKAAEADSGGGDDGSFEDAPAVDPFDLLEAVEILSKLPKNFYSQIEEKKWQERKMALEACEKLVTENQKLASDDYADLVKALKRVLSKDTNILLVVIAVKCIGTLAKALRKKFHPYALVCLEAMFERFKEKKPNVVTALQEAVDAIYLTTNIQAVSETVVEALGHKNPSIRCQVGLFLSRSLAKTKPATMNKALIKLFVQPLCKNIDHSTPDVREAAFQSIGTMLKLVGESKLHPFLADLDKFKQEKINECAGKSEVQSAKVGGSATTASKPPKQAPTESKSTTSVNREKREVKKKVASEVKTVKGGKKAKSSSKVSANEGPPPESELSDEAVDELVAKVISSEERSQILNNNWKERLAGLQSSYQKLQLLERSEIPCQAFVKLLSIKPGWKDNNFNCMIEKFKLLTLIAENGAFSRTSAGICLTATVDKIGDIKSGAGAKKSLTAMSEATGFPWLAEQVLQHAMTQKNPKIQSEALNWLSQAIQEFGISGLNVKLIIEKVKTALAATNPVVRTAALSLIGTLALFIGEKIKMFFEGEKPALAQQIDAEVAKVKGQSPPAPTRGLRKQSGVSGDVQEEEVDGEPEAGFNFDDMVTRVDISGRITGALINQINDSNWKMRKEGLDNVIEILNDAKFVTPDLGELPAALKARLSDSNKILLSSSLNILTQLSTSLGPHSAKHLHTVASNIVGALADSKPQVRQAALKCMDTWLENTRLSMWLEGEMMSSALSVPKHTFLRIELLSWLGDKLVAVNKMPANAREGLEMCVPVVYACCEDRSGEVRSKAQSFLPALLRHLSYEKLTRGTGKLSASSKAAITTLLEKAREQMPASASSSKTSVSSTSTSKDVFVDAVEKPVAPKQAQSGREKRPSSKRADSSKRAPSAQRKKAAEEDTSPLFIKLPNGKEQRMRDEAKLKTIKWSFGSPRDELISQLQQQLQTCVGSTLLTAMFHADFQQHLKAISMLYQGLSSYWDDTVACLDVILRWFTLRFYDKNTTVHIKSLEYLKALLDQLIENDYRMGDYEASAFLPHLIVKIGESKDNIRKAVHGIIKQVSLVYPSSKLFNFIMDGIKSKNARQRTECLDEIGLLIERFGVGVCQPTPAKALKEVASNISDRDKGVRSAALNAIVAAYNVTGDIVLKQVGKLSEKDMSMLEERVKRSGKFVESNSAPRNSESSETCAPSKPIKETKSVPTNMSKQTIAVNQSKSADSVNELASVKSDPSTDAASLIPEHILKGIAELPEINVDHLLVPLPVPDFIKQHEQGALSANAGATLDLVISQVANPQLDTSITAIHELYEVLKHKEKIPLLQERMDHLLTSSTTQIRMISSRYLPLIISADQTVSKSDGNVNENNVRSLCKSHFAFLLEVFDCDELASKASAYVVFDFLRTVIQLMINEKFVNMPHSAKLIQILNMLVLRMFDHCDPTAIVCATVKMQMDSMDGGSSAYADLAVKCVWKLGRLIPGFLRPQEQDGFKHQPLKVAPLLAELDRFWSTYPRGHPIYSRLKSEVPLRSLKTIIFILCKQPGVKIMEELHMIPNPQGSEVVSIILKVTGHSASKIPHRSLSEKKENMGALPAVSLDVKLSAIFKKIGDRQQTKQGLLELYEFKQDHPQYDIEPRIEGLEIECFREYVKRGLKKIETEKLSAGARSTDKITRPSTALNSADKDYWTRLNKLRATCGLEPLSKEDVRNKCGVNRPATAAGTVATKILAPSTDSLNHPEPQNISIKSLTQNSRGTGLPLPSGGMSGATEASKNPTNISELKRRLEQIKQSSSRK